MNVFIKFVYKKPTVILTITFKVLIIKQCNLVMNCLVMYCKMNFLSQNKNWLVY